MADQDQAPGLSLADLQNVVVFIDAAVARGAVRGEELSGVAALRERFVSFIESNNAVEEAASEPEAEEEAAE